MVISEDKIINGRIRECAYIEDEELGSVIIPEGVTDIGELAFYGCKGLRTVRFPLTLKYIREEAFGESSIEEAILPESMVLIAEKAFFSCGSLRKISVPGRGTVIERDAFGCCDALKEGFVARGYPDGAPHHEELLYTLLWCSCPDMHSPETSMRAKSFISEYEELVMEWIITRNIVPAMNGLVKEGLLKGDIDRYISRSALDGRSEITALLMQSGTRSFEEEFAL